MHISGRESRWNEFSAAVVMQQSQQPGLRLIMRLGALLLRTD